MRSIKHIIKNILYILNILEKPVSNPMYKKLIGARFSGNIENVKIGENVSFSGDVLVYANAPIEIGDNTMIAYRTILHTSTHDYNDHPMWTKRIDKPIKIGTHVWIGTAAVILPGIIIGDYAVVGAGSVVTANVPEGAIVAGNPAKIIRFREKYSYKKEPSITRWDEGLIVSDSYCNKECKFMNS